MRVYANTPLDACVDVCSYVCVYMCVYQCQYACMCVLMLVCACVCKYPAATCVHVRIDMSMRVYMSMRVCAGGDSGCETAGSSV